MNTPTLHRYRIRCAGLEYIAMATSACMAIDNAIALHGTNGVSARRLAP